MTIPIDAGTKLAEGVYDYTVDDQPRAKEVWRLNELADGRLHIQSLLGSGQHIYFGMDLVLDPSGTPHELHAQVDGQGGKSSAVYTFGADGVTGTLTAPDGVQPLTLALPPGTLPLPEAIAMRYLIGQRLDLTSTNEQPLSLCIIPIMDEHNPPLRPFHVAARATVLGVETVELLLADVSATHVLIEWPNHSPQHAWFDERRFPVQWYWLGHGAPNESTAYQLSLSRYAWHTR